MEKTAGSGNTSVQIHKSDLDLKGRTLRRPLDCYRMVKQGQRTGRVASEPILQKEKEGARWCRWSSKLASPTQKSKRE